MQVVRFLFCCMFLFLTGCTGYKIPLSASEPVDKIVVRKGDTLYSLSKKYQVSLKEVIKVNRLSYPYTLSIGQELKIPKATVHVVQKSETLYSISKQYNTTVSNLSRQNRISAPYTLSVGQRLIVPNGIGTSYVASARTSSKTINKTKNTKKVTAKKEKKGKASKKATKNVKVPYKKFLWPVRGKILSDYGDKGKGRHNDGINIAAGKGTLIKAAEKGMVVYADNGLKGYGNLILLKHDKGWITAYAHADKILVKKGQSVQKGQKIGTVGKTGEVKTPQLHFEIRYKTKIVNPKSYLQ